MTYNAETIPIVSPLMVRKVKFLRRTDGLLFDNTKHAMDVMGGSIVMHEIEMEDVGIAESRLSQDDDIVDCSIRVFTVTNEMLIQNCTLSVMIFPSRRWRNHRVGEEILSMPTNDDPLLYIGNPIRILNDPKEGITVMRIPEFLIKSGMELGY